MISRRQTQRAWPAMLLLLLAAPASAPGADGEVTFGTQWWDQTAREAKFEEFRDNPNGLVLESFVVKDVLKKGRYVLIGTDAFQDDQATTLLYRKPFWTAGIEYSRTPHNFSFIARTPYTEIAPGVLTLPDTLQRRVQENPANQALNTLLDMTRNGHRVPLGFRTDILSARVKARPSPGLQLDVRGSRRQREGTKAYGGSFGQSNAAEITEPVHQTIAQGEARLSYVHRRVVLEAVGGVDAFQNDVDALVFDNPRRYTDSPTAGSSRGQIDLHPENLTIRGALKAGLQLPRRTALTAYLGLSRLTQDDRWLPMTINAAVLQPDTFPLPGTGTDAKVTVLTGDVRLTGSPSRYVTGTLRFRHHDYDNQTRQHVMPGQVAYDQSWQPTPLLTHPIGFTNTTYGADVSLTPVARVLLLGTAEHIRRDRTFREVARDNEWAFEGKARVRPRAGVELEGKYRRGDRKREHLDEEHYQNASGQFIEQPSLRRFDVGDRQQEQARGLIGWSPNPRVQISAAYEYLRNKYEDDELSGIGAPLQPDTSDTQLGLLDESRRSISADASLQLTDRIELSGGYGWTHVYTNQRSRESGAVLRLDDSTAWQARLKDWFVYANAAVTWRAVPERISVVGSYEFERSPGVYRLSNFRGTALDLPGTKYRRQSVGAEAWYKLDEGMSVGARYAWEEYSVTDFANENVPLVSPVTGTSNAIFLGDSFQDYRAHMVGLLVRRTF